MSKDIFLRNLWRNSCGLPDEQPPPPVPPLRELRETEWSPTFERLMRNRLVMGSLRYGRLRAPGKPSYNRISSVLSKTWEYMRTGNDELLVDVADLCLMEFEEGKHPKKHWKAGDDTAHTPLA